MGKMKELSILIEEAEFALAQRSAFEAEGDYWGMVDPTLIAINLLEEIITELKG